MSSSPHKDIVVHMKGLRNGKMRVSAETTVGDLKKAIAVLERLGDELPVILQVVEEGTVGAEARVDGSAIQWVLELDTDHDPVPATSARAPLLIRAAESEDEEEEEAGDEADASEDDEGSLEPPQKQLRQPFTIYVADADLPDRISVRASDSVESLKAKIANLTGFHVDQQRLIFGGFILEGSRSLGYYNIRSEATVHLELRRDPWT